MIRPLALALALAATSPTPRPPEASADAGGCLLPPLRAGARPWRAGEELAFDVDVMGVVHAGTIHSSVEQPVFGGTQLPLRARARNTSVFAKVKRARAQAMSWVDATTLRPQRYRDESDEDGRRRSTDVRLDRGGDRVALAWTLDGKHGTREFERRGDVLDLLSAVYYLRAAQLAPGRTVCFDLVANRRYWRLEGSLAPGTERVETPTGAFQAIRFDATLTRLPTPDDPKVRTRPLHLWFSDDPRRVPVAAVTEVDLGPVRALLARGASPRAAAR